MRKRWDGRMLTVERQIGEDESIFASKVAERLDEGYMTYLRHKRMED